MDFDEIKHKLRRLKRLEIDRRFNGKLPQHCSLIWESFFDLRSRGKEKSKAKYSIKDLAEMTRDEYKSVVDEYLSFLYNDIYKTTGAQGITNYDREALIKLDLPYNAEERDIKRRFHELAKMHHPDTGGDNAKFLELMKIYRKLVGK